MNARSRLIRALEAMLMLGVAVLTHAHHANAHEARPAYLALTETTPDHFDVVWRTPVVSGMRLPVVLQLPDGATNVTKPSWHELSDSVVERTLIAVPGGLGGKRLEFVGLPGTITDVLVRVETRDGGHSTTLVHPSQPWIAIPATRGTIAVAGAYVMHGVEHILFGYDHLLFVLALILIARNVRQLLATVTAFTLAHSITLGLSALGVVHVPGPPVEATIALSILLLACEITRLRRGERSLTAQCPWLVAFAFGLLHGFGFAGALAEIGLPRGDIPLALFAFNVGIEAGQLGFIAAVLTLRGLVQRLPIPDRVSALMRPAATFAIGTMAAFWFVERLSSFWPGS
jgi:hydrogenase/urease accessory protein HupE